MKISSKKKLGFVSSEMAGTSTPTPKRREQSEAEMYSDSDKTILDLKGMVSENDMFRNMMEMMKSIKDAQSELTARVNSQSDGEANQVTLMETRLMTMSK